MVVVLGQFLVLAHEITVRHFRCAEHGEPTHLLTLSVSHFEKTSAVTAVRAGKIEEAVGHEHCTTALMLQRGISSPVFRDAVRAAPPAATVAPAIPAPPRERAFLLAYAPKTSPPFGGEERAA